MEVFCKMDKADIIAKLGNGPGSDPEFKSEYALVKSGVLGSEKVQLARVETVHTFNAAGMRVSRKVAFVRAGEFSRMGCGELGSPSCTAQIVSMPTYEHGVATMADGTIVEFHKLVPGTGYETVELFVDVGRRHDIELLGPANTYRRQQPGERYQVALQNMIGLLTYLSTNLLTYLLTDRLTDRPTDQLTYLPIYLTYLPTYPIDRPTDRPTDGPTYLLILTYQPTYLPTDPLTYIPLLYALLTYLLTYLPAYLICLLCLPTYLPTYLPPTFLLTFLTYVPTYPPHSLLITITTNWQTSSSSPWQPGLGASDEYLPR